jgi:hypothetical protein
MPDNRALLKNCLGELGLTPQREEEILREVGDHVEDHTTALEAGGIANEEAFQKAVGSVEDWPKFREEIYRAETAEATMNYQMTYRSRVFWLPALVALTLSSGLLAVFQHAGIEPRFYWPSGEPGTYHAFFAFYVPWLIALPLVGAVAAFWSQLAGGKAPYRMLAALAPSLGMLGVFLIIPFIAWPINIVMSVHHHRHISFSLTGSSVVAFITGFLILLANWVLLPAIALFIGAAPFLRKAQPQS